MLSDIVSFIKMRNNAVRSRDMKHIISPLDLSITELDDILSLAGRIYRNPEKYSKVCDGKKLATLFYEPSTRTRLSFEAAMMNLGGNVLGFSSANSSSVSKGESIADTIRVISYYADICAMRHPKEGAPLVASMYSGIPIINAGDGGHNHPTQTLTDLLTIKELKGDLNNLTIGVCGDLKFGRTVHSLINAMVRYQGIKFIMISPDELKIPEYLRNETLDANNIPYVETNVLEDVNEIATEVDDDPRAVYFKQAQYGVYLRMALIMTLLDITEPDDKEV